MALGQGNGSVWNVDRMQAYLSHVKTLRPTMSGAANRCIETHCALLYSVCVCNLPPSLPPSLPAAFSPTTTSSRGRLTSATLPGQPLGCWRALSDLLKVHCLKGLGLHRSSCLEVLNDSTSPLPVSSLPTLAHARLMCHREVLLQDAIVSVIVMECSMQVYTTYVGMKISCDQ